MLPLTNELVNDLENQENNVKDLSFRRQKNPFLASSEIKVLRKKIVKRTVDVSDDDLYGIDAEDYQVVSVEADSFTKAYQIKDQLGLIKSLNPQSCRLLLYVQGKLSHGNDSIDLPRTKVAKDLDVHPNTVSLGIQGLIDSGVLCKKGKSDYWINPIVLFNGNRYKYFKEQAPSKINYVDMKAEIKEFIPKPKKA